MGMTKTQNIRIARPTASSNGKISAMSMVKSLVASGVPLASIALTAQLTDAERAELGIA
jgi:hypothetical protein